MAFLDYQGFTFDEKLNIKTFSYQMGLEDLPYIYNVDYAVGPGGPNAREDVELVQTLLRIAYKGIGSGPGNLVVDGLFGPVTAAYIVHFQKLAPFVVQDGRIDKARGILGSASNRFYTIAWLNAFAKRERPDLYGDPKVLATDMPAVIWRLRSKCSIFMALNSMDAARSA